MSQPLSTEIDGLKIRYSLSTECVESENGGKPFAVVRIESIKVPEATQKEVAYLTGRPKIPVIYDKKTWHDYYTYAFDDWQTLTDLITADLHQGQKCPHGE